MRRRRVVLRERCAACAAEIGLTRAELDHGSARCGACGERMAVKLLGSGHSPLRAADHVELRVIGPGPPTGRIIETLGAIPALEIRTGRDDERSSPAAAAALTFVLAGAIALGIVSPWLALLPLPIILGLLWMVTMPSLGRERLRVVNDALEHQRRLAPWARTRVPLAEIANVVDDGSRLAIVDGAVQTRMVVFDSAPHGPEARAWVKQWILDPRPRRR
jgi:hypothetical protein